MTTEATVADTTIPKEALSAQVVFDDSTQMILKSSEGALMIAQAYEITNAEEAQEVADERNANLKAVDGLKKAMEYILEPVRMTMNRTREIFKPRIEQREAAIAHLNRLLGGWTAQEQARIAKENAEREETARKLRQKAEAEAKAAQAKADEIARQKREEAEEQERLRQKAVQEGNDKAAREAAERSARATEQAAQAIESGNATAAKVTMEAAAAAPAPIATVAKVAGNQTRDKYVTELKEGFTEEQAKIAIVKAAAEGNVQLYGLIDINTSALNKLAAGLKLSMVVPGYTAVNRPIMAGSKK